MESQWNKQVTWKFAKKKLIRKYIIQTNYSHQMIYRHTPTDYYELQKAMIPLLCYSSCRRGQDIIITPTEHFNNSMKKAAKWNRENKDKPNYESRKKFFYMEVSGKNNKGNALFFIQI